MPGYLEIAPRGASHSFRRRLGLGGETLGRNDDGDLKLFVMSFTAFFICIYTLIL
jgi:hypothetical protein